MLFFSLNKFLFNPLDHPFSIICHQNFIFIIAAAPNKYADTPTNKAALKPKSNDSIIEATPPSVEAIPFIPHIQGIRPFDNFSVSFIPMGNSIPIKKAGIATTAAEKNILVAKPA